MRPFVLSLRPIGALILFYVLAACGGGSGNGSGLGLGSPSGAAKADEAVTDTAADSGKARTTASSVASSDKSEIRYAP